MLNNGKLFIVSTPIGNLSDITLRAIDTLKGVDLITAEDTRHSATLLKQYGIKTPVISLHNFNETKRAKFIIEKLQQGENVALISDAGTPLISDPGYHLVSAARKNNLEVVPIPGACATIAALSVSGLPTDKFTFRGFLPAKTKQRVSELEKLTDKTETIIFYESPHRLIPSLNDMLTVFGKERYVVIAKELTKTFENIFCDTIPNIISWLIEKPERQKGEFVILIKGVEKKIEVDQEALRILELLSQELPVKKAAMLASQITGVNKNLLYKICVTLKKSSGVTI